MFFSFSYTQFFFKGLRNVCGGIVADYIGIMDSRVKNLSELNERKGFKVVHMNVRSLLKKVDQLRILLFNSQIDVITLSETWLNSAISSTTVKMDNYVMYRQDRERGKRVKKRGGGLLTLINSKYAADSEEMAELNRCDLNMETQWMVIHRQNCKDVVICNMYRPPSGNLDKFIDYMDECLKSLDLDRNEIFLLGDVNVNYKNKVSREYKKVNFFVQSNGLSQLIKETTRNTDKSKSLIDLILTNSKYISMSGTLDHYVSDHQPIYVVQKKQRDARPCIEFQGRSYRNYDKSMFRDRLLGQDWEEYYKIKDPSKAWGFIIDKVLPILDEMCPIKTFKIKNYRPEWITAELIEQILDRDYFYKKAKDKGDEDSWNIAKHLRNVTNYNIRKAKRDFILSELDNCEDDSKKFWHTIKSVIPGNKGDVRQDILLKDGGKKVERKQVAHFINDFFINIGNVGSLCNKKREEINQRNIVTDTESDTGWSPCDFSTNEVLRVIKDINVSKSSGLTNISSFVVKEVFTILIHQVTFMMNLSIKTSVFPEAWKEALVIPIPKSGSPTMVQNYRPISLLPLPGKIIEKLIHKQLIDNSLLTEYQHGFRKSHSCIHSVAQVTNYIEKKKDSKLPTLAAFVDFRKAFDCVQHTMLVRKLSGLGISQRIINWFSSYLTGRKQRVLANNVYSSFQTITQGVPQGSVLGPLFYILYANDITDIVNKCKIALYADDTVLYTADSCFETSIKKLREDMLALEGWCNVNGIRMNSDKTKVMIFGSAKTLEKLPDVSLNVANVPLQTVSSYRYLGVTLDSQMNYAKHISKLIANVSVKLKQLRRMRSFLNVKAAKLVYKNMILPVIEYGDIFLTGASVANKKKLQVLQNRGLRCALSAHDMTSTDELHDEIGLLRLKYRREVHLLNYMFDQSRNEVNLRTVRKTGAVTRSCKKKLLKIKRPRTERFKKSMSYQGPKKWNLLPESLQLTDSRTDFKSRIKEHVALKALDARLNFG